MFKMLLVVALLWTTAIPGQTAPTDKAFGPQGQTPAKHIRMPQIQGTAKRPVAAIYCDCEGLSLKHPGGVRQGVSVIALVWADGTVVWSENHVSGGPPYFKGNMPVATVSDVLKRVQDPEAGVEFKYIPYLPGGCGVHIAVDCSLRVFTAYSQHELVDETFSKPQSDELAGEDRSLDTLGIAAIRQFQKNWQNTKKDIVGIIPAQGQSIGSIRFVLRERQDEEKGEEATSSGTKKANSLKPRRRKVLGRRGRPTSFGTQQTDYSPLLSAEETDKPAVLRYSRLQSPRRRSDWDRRERGRRLRCPTRPAELF